MAQIAIKSSDLFVALTRMEAQEEILKNQCWESFKTYVI